MKKIKLIITTLILMLPIYIKAETYFSSVSKVNNYILNYRDYNEYIHIDSNLPYNYEEGKNKIDASYQNGGMISKDEYLITNINGNSYLASGINYWTLTKYDRNKYYTVGIFLSDKNMDLDSNIKVTEYIKNDIEITGSGTKTNPWVFKEIFSVTLKSTNQNRGLLSTKECSQGEKHEQITVRKTDGSTSYIYICPTEHFEYNAEKSTCKPFLTYTENLKFELGDSNSEKLVDNMICTIDFAYQTTKVSFVSKGEKAGTNPSDVYLANNKSHWFKDSKGYTIISSITIPQKTGYIFGGYYTEENGAGTQIINANGIFNTTSFEGTQLYPHWTPITFYVSFNTNGGNNSLSTIQCTYDQDCIIPEATGVLTKNNHTFWGWNKTAKNPVGGNPSVDFKDKANVKNQVKTDGETLNLYAMWRIDYYCLSGETLKEDTKKGWICIFPISSRSVKKTGSKPCSGGWYSEKGYAGAGTYCNTTYYETEYYCSKNGSVYSGSGSSAKCYIKARNN